jgi:hypothetical protein
MAIDKLTPLGEIGGYYRTTLISALKCFALEVDKARKQEEKIDGETAHLDDKDEIVKQFRLCLNAPTAESIAGTPLGKAMAEGASKHQQSADEQAAKKEQAELDLVGIDLTDDGVLMMMMRLAGYCENVEVAKVKDAMSAWDLKTRGAVYRWTKAMQLAGTPGAHAKVPKRPKAVPKEWLNTEKFSEVVFGHADPETLEPLPDLTEKEIADWIAIGPWQPQPLEPAREGDPVMFGLVWFWNVVDGEERPAYEFHHVELSDAQKVAATINRRIRHERRDQPTDADTQAPAPPSEAAPSEPPTELPAPQAEGMTEVSDDEALSRKRRRRKPKAGDE